MDPPVKSGPLLLQQPSGLLLGAKRWKKSWFVLYPASPHGVARLEFFDCKEGAAPADRISTKKLDKKIVRLADCVSVAPALDCSPKDGLAAFCLETSSRTYVFASEPPEAADWMAKLCEAAFLVSGAVNEFWVTVQKTEAAERCKLQGRYLLKASWNELILREAPSSLPLYTWPYRLLRRYGRDKVMFSFEAGRRCESGAGNFTFETKQGNEIFHVVEAAIQAQKAQVEEHRQSSSSLEMEAPGIFSLQNAMANSLSLEGEGTAASLERRAPRGALAARASVAGEGKEATVPKGQNPWLSSPSLRPSLSGTAGSLEDTSNVYSEPLDALKGTRLRPDSLYADPLDSQWQEEGPGRGSSLAEEQPRARTGEGHGLPSDKQHIYDEPEGRAPWPTPASAAIYDEARLPCEAWRTQGLESQAGYELLYLPGTGDYAVPAFHQKAGLKPSRPSPAPKPPRAHKKSAQLEASKPRAAPTPGLEGACNSNNSNNASDPLYSRVIKPPSAPGPLGPEQSVDEGRPAAVYEDLGEI
ncbi:PREDICTED: docking protein 1 [Thamnophis sirtalis]|uniref:Docking protein 1 n=1 Tax=Thamnophis sirtalis TaxID=35019 RepID=A0A6I9X3Z9_9SAUR|nr:PREDICTED: docking protein 1 [Thamnophis sirtalis]